MSDIMNANCFQQQVLVIVFLSIFISIDGVLFGDEAGADLIAKALESSANIHSCYVEYSLISFNPMPESQYQKEKAEWREKMLEVLKGSKNPEETLERAEKALRENQLKPREIKGNYLFDAGKDGRKKTKFNNSYRNAKSGDWSLPTNVLSEIGPNRTVSVMFDEKGKSIWILKMPNMIADFFQAGRFQGNLADLGIENQLGSKEEIKKMIDKLDCKIMGTETYDTDAQATIVEVRKKNEIIRRCWIDPSRGFVCPRIQSYHDDILVEEYQSKDFVLHPETGFWFPTSYQIARYDKDSNLRFKQEFAIAKESIKINQAISDHEFAIDVPIDFFVDDARSGKLTRFQAIDKGELSLTKSGLDLDKCQWLTRVIPSMDVESAGGASGTVRIVLIVAGLVLILLYVFFRIRKWGLPIILLAFVIASGCSQSPVNDSSLSVTPSVLDFGQVRVSDSPVQTQFTLRNNGVKPVTILDITSGCGCTAVEYPKEPIARKQIVSATNRLIFLENE
jgi:hypothetical protein